MTVKPKLTAAHYDMIKQAKEALALPHDEAKVERIQKIGDSDSLADLIRELKEPYTQDQSRRAGLEYRAANALANVGSALWSEAEKECDQLRTVLRDLLAAYDPERAVIDVEPDDGCMECTLGTTPRQTGPCAYHRALALIEKGGKPDDLQRTKA